MSDTTETGNELTCTLTDSQKQDLKKLYDDFKKEELSKKSKWMENAAKVLKQYNSYKEKILDDKLSLDEYTNIGGEYLCDFLENRSDVFGGARPTGSANSYMVKKNDENRMKDGKKVFSGPYTITKHNKTDAKKEDADTVYKSDIIPLLKEIVNADNNEKIKKLIESTEYQNYNANQIKRKMVVINNISINNVIVDLEEDKINIKETKPLHDYFGHFYDEKKVDQLIKFFNKDADPKSIDFFEKSQTLIKLMKNEIIMLPQKENSLWETKIISSFLWKIVNAIDLTSESNPNVILYGAPGTGKTFEVKNIIKFACKGKSERYKWVQFHPSFSYEDFIEGVKPVSLEGKDVKLELVNGIFKDFCIKAKIELEKYFADESKDKEEPIFYFVADEINRANLSAVFGETLSLLEASYRDYKRDDSDKDVFSNNVMDLQNSTLERQQILKEKVFDKEKHYNSEGTFGIPRNIRFIGMMNDVDKSIDTFDLALRRRFRWIRKDCDYEALKNVLTNKGLENINNYIEQCEELNSYISNTLHLGKSYEFGHSFFMKICDFIPPKGRNTKKITVNNKESLFKEFLEPTLKEYLRSFFTEDEIESKLTDAKKLFVDGTNPK